MQGQYNMRSPAVKRLMKEAQELREPTELFHAQPLDDNLFEWHFTLRGPDESDFDGGVYHGRIILPPEYPMKPPSIILLTPNGRFEIFKKICLSISGHHPESWQPSWSIRTALLAIIGFMPTHGGGAIGSLDYTPEERKVLARKSQDWKCPDCGDVSKKLKPVTQASEKFSQEAKELASQINFQGEKGTGSPGTTSEQETSEAAASGATSPPTPTTPASTSCTTTPTPAPTPTPMNMPQFPQGQPPFPFPWTMPPGWGNFPQQNSGGAMNNNTFPRFPYPPPAMMPPPVAGAPGMPFYPPMPFFPPMMRGFPPFPGQPGFPGSGFPPSSSPTAGTVPAAGATTTASTAQSPQVASTGSSVPSTTAATASSLPAATTRATATTTATVNTTPETVGAVSSAPSAPATPPPVSKDSSKPPTPSPKAAATSKVSAERSDPEKYRSEPGTSEASVDTRSTTPETLVAEAEVAEPTATELRRRTNATSRSQDGHSVAQTTPAQPQPQQAVPDVHPEPQPAVQESAMSQFFGSYSLSSIVLMVLLTLAITLLLARRFFLHYAKDFSGDLF